MNVTVTGGTGFVGRAAIRALLARGDHVTAVTRNPAAARGGLPGSVDLVGWEDGPLDAAVAASDAVLHLAGEQVVGRRWTRELKDEIMKSRVDTAGRVVSAMKRAERRPRVLVSASGVGFYGARGNDPATEMDAQGADFLAEVAAAWEGAARAAEPLGVRVVCARLGIVFGKGGGAISEMARPFRFFVGGPIGTGAQVVSWVHLDDAVRILLLCLDDPALSGPVNVVAPNAVTNAELAEELGRVLHRPSAFRVPSAAIRMLFGQGAEPILTGQRAVPAVLLAHGFSFDYPRVADALKEVLG